ncbi:MAG: cell filamentation protein Fic [Dehalococcoidia bacterium]|nr:cell filamentation protein Fic [Dehalococcoidia bacterium]
MVHPSQSTDQTPGTAVPVSSHPGEWAFVPRPLPYRMELDGDTMLVVGRAEGALGRLGSMGVTMANPNLLIQPLLRREAVMSNRIEGTFTDLDQLLLFEASGTDTLDPADRDSQEVLNHVRAQEYAFECLQANNPPLSLRLLKEIHKRLMPGTRGEHRAPGKFRRVPVGITRPHGPPFRPPPVPQMTEALDVFEKFLHRPPPNLLLPVVEAALVHYQFEVIHPFIDGNGRMGRLLIPLLLVERKILPTFVLYLSAYFARHQETYYDLLLKVSQTGAWQEWIRFFAQGVFEESHDTFLRCLDLFALREKYRSQVQRRSHSPAPGELLDQLFATPFLTIAQAAQRLDQTYHGARRIVKMLEDEGILLEFTGKKTRRIYAAHEIVDIISADSAAEPTGAPTPSG